jgi:hypothetical protein
MDYQHNKNDDNGVNADDDSIILLHCRHTKTNSIHCGIAA